MKPVRPRKQPVSLTQLHQGFMTALEQAERLAEQSLILAHKNLFSGALSKAILGLEEIGKNRLLLCQAGTVVMGKPGPWKAFWHAYRSHQEKLALAIKWASILSPQLVSPEDVDAHLKFITEEASHLDRRKQESQYVNFDGKQFTAPRDEELREEAIILGIVLESFCCQLRKEYPIGLPADEFLELVSEKLRLSRALGLIHAEGGVSAANWAKAIAERNSPVFARDGVLPSVEAFQERVVDRYKVVPPRIAVTLRQLNNSEEFEAFYDCIRARYGYPDWVIVSAIYNIAFNARVMSQTQKRPSPDEISRWMEWAEKPADKPLPVELFTNEDSFNFALDLWLAAFLAGLGVAIPDVTSENMQKIRRVASRYYSIFEYDVEHWPIFHFGGDTEESSKA